MGPRVLLAPNSVTEGGWNKKKGVVRVNRRDSGGLIQALARVRERAYFGRVSFPSCFVTFFGSIVPPSVAFFSRCLAYQSSIFLSFQFGLATKKNVAPSCLRPQRSPAPTRL